MAIYLLISGRRRWLIDIPVLAAAIVMIVMNTDPKAIWSPYYYITINKFETPNITESAPPPEALRGRDPPIYLVRVNQFGYHYDAALDSRLYTPGTKGAEYIRWIELEHKVPYAVADSCDRILVVGAGGGFDVEAALECGTKHVDAVEIDPAIIDISRHFNAGAPYSDPRVSIHIDDARSYMAKAKPGYDMVVFGFLDSQALFSTMSNVRLDGYVYTVESLRSAFRLLNDHGMLTLSFFLGRPWLGPKLYELVAEATGRTPAMYLDTGGRGLILCVPRDPTTILPQKVFQYTRAAYSPLPKIDLPTDDWPFLYLIRKTVPSDYLIAIASLLAFSVATIAWLRGRSFGSGDVHFGLLGMGFLLLETKGISDSTLFFGATWFVTMLVVTGVLLMVMGANLVAELIPRFSLWMYAPLFAILAVLLIVPRESVLQYDFAGRLMWTLLVVPLPVFFAGIIFSTTFRETAVPSSVFGANLIGAMIGGFCEYLGMAVGNHRLSLLVAIAYLGSLLVVASARRQGRPL
jgi:hypothetical protein